MRTFSPDQIGSNKWGRCGIYWCRNMWKKNTSTWHTHSITEETWKYMRLQTNEQISCMSRECIVSVINHRPSPNASLVDLQATLSTLQCMYTLTMWHDHSTILQTGYILFAVWVVYDPGMFYSQAEWQEQQTGQSGANIQSQVEEPVIYMIAPSNSSPADQLALVSDRIECLQELSRSVTASIGVEVKDTLRFFVVTNLHNVIMYTSMHFESRHPAYHYTLPLHVTTIFQSS